MPRRARLDAPGTLHHVMVRGIGRRRIVNDVADHKNFVERLGELAVDTKTAIYAWALLTNHAHILLRSSEIGLSGFMRRLLTGYAIFYKRIIKEAEAKIKYQLPVKERGQKIDELITRICKKEKVSIAELKSGSRRKEVSGVRAMIAIGMVKKQGVALAEVARRVGVSTAAVSKISKRDRQ